MTSVHRRPAFVSCSAQDDNLGDLVIRRTAVRWIEDAGLDPHVLVSGVSRGFVDGLELRAGAVLYETTRPWIHALLDSSRRNPTTLVYTPGPQSLTASISHTGHAVVNAGLAAAVTRGGGHVVKLGRSMEPGSRFMLGLERFLLRRSSLYTVRDEESSVLLNDPRVEVAPDLAWAAELELELDRSEVVDRTRLAMSFRSDRSFDRAAIGELVAQAVTRGLVPTFVSQVKRDDEVHQTLAAELGCEVVGWPADRSDSAQLRTVMQAYQQSSMVVSNRLHSVIFGMAAGAVPVGLAGPGDTKIARTLAVVGLGHHVITSPSVPQHLWDADVSLVTAETSARLTTVKQTFTSLVPR